VQKYLISILERKTRLEVNVMTLKTKKLHVSNGLVMKKCYSLRHSWRFSIHSTTLEDH
jgi:hypothetical protein